QKLTCQEELGHCNFVTFATLMFSGDSKGCRATQMAESSEGGDLADARLSAPYGAAIATAQRLLFVTDAGNGKAGQVASKAATFPGRKEWESDDEPRKALLHQVTSLVSKLKQASRRPITGSMPWPLAFLMRPDAKKYNGAMTSSIQVYCPRAFVLLPGSRGPSKRGKVSICTREPCVRR
ncbi:unnamed protein product, partial [Symbiodinium necroappetens]